MFKIVELLNTFNEEIRFWLFVVEEDNLGVNADYSLPGRKAASDNYFNYQLITIIYKKWEMLIIICDVLNQLFKDIQFSVAEDKEKQEILIAESLKPEKFWLSGWKMTDMIDWLIIKTVADSFPVSPPELISCQPKE